MYRANNAMTAHSKRNVRRAMLKRSASVLNSIRAMAKNEHTPAVPCQISRVVADATCYLTAKVLFAWNWKQTRRAEAPIGAQDYPVTRHWCLPALIPHTSKLPLHKACCANRDDLDSRIRDIRQRELLKCASTIGQDLVAIAMIRVSNRALLQPQPITWLRRIDTG